MIERLGLITLYIVLAFSGALLTKVLAPEASLTAALIFGSQIIALLVRLDTKN